MLSPQGWLPALGAHHVCLTGEMGSSPLKSRGDPLRPSVGPHLELALTHCSLKSPLSQKGHGSCHHPGQHRPSLSPALCGAYSGEEDTSVFSPVLCPHPGPSALTLTSFPVTQVRCGEASWAGPLALPQIMLKGTHVVLRKCFAGKSILNPDTTTLSIFRQGQQQAALSPPRTLALVGYVRALFSGTRTIPQAGSQSPPCPREPPPPWPHPSCILSGPGHGGAFPSTVPATPLPG